MEYFEFTGSMHEPVCKGGDSNGQVKDFTELFNLLRYLTFYEIIHLREGNVL